VGKHSLDAFINSREFVQKTNTYSEKIYSLPDCCSSEVFRLFRGP
jgi:hypothetical protein